MRPNSPFQMCVQLQLVWNLANLVTAINTKNPNQSLIFGSANFRI